MPARSDPTFPLVPCDWLAAHQDDPDLVIVEVAWDPPSKAPYFSAGHIPGAHYAWWKDLCWHETDREFPTPDEMARRLASFGMNDERTLVLVGDPIQFATYAYWVLTLTGLSHLARVLDGGRQIWIVEHRPLSAETPESKPTGSVTPRSPDTSSRVGRDDVLAGLDDPHRLVVDMRSDEEFSGARVAPPSAPFDHGAERKGRIPGARHLYYERLLTDDGRFLDAAEIATLFEAADAEPGRDVITYCRNSHRASLGWFAATFIARRSGVRIYDGSWTEWGSIVGFPIER